VNDGTFYVWVNLSAITVSDYGPNSQLMLSARINWSRIDLPIGEGGKADQIAGREAGQELEQFFAASLGESTRLEEAGGEGADGP
jgi:hypothetical protein